MHWTRLIVAGVILPVGLVACTQRDPASEQPLEPEGGNYAIRLTGDGLAEMLPQDKEPADSVCVPSGEGGALADRLARNYFTLHPGCTSSKRPRQGNLIGGTVVCPLDPQRAQGTWTIDYEGTISADRVELSGSMDMDIVAAPNMSAEERRQAELGAAMFKAVGIRIVAERTGECGQS